MRLLLLNGNSNAALTAQMTEEARRILGQSVEVLPDTATESVPYIGSRRDCALAGAELVKLVEIHLEKDDRRYDAILLSCFGEPGIAAVREISPVPVVGMLESSLLTAQQLGGRFSILTPGERWPKMIEEVVYDLGLARRCLAIEAINIEDLKLPSQREEMHRRLAETLIRHQKRLNPDVTIIGGAAFAGLATSLPAQHNSRLIDCFEAAILQCQALMQLGGESTRIL